MRNNLVKTPKTAGEKPPDAMAKKLKTMKNAGMAAAGGKGPVMGKGSVGPKNNRYMR